MLRFNYITLGVLCLFISGCGASLFTSRETNPSIQDMTVAPHFWPWSPSAVNNFSTTASRRIVTVKSTGFGEEVISCAEPSPDVGEAFASAIADSIKIAAQLKGIPVELSNQYAKTVATQITPLVYRTQGLQLYRDAIHSLCIDRMNGWVSKEEYKISSNNISDYKSYGNLRQYFFDQAVDLIKEELPVMQKTQSSFYENSKTGDVKINLADFAKILKELKLTENSTTLPSPSKKTKGTAKSE